jgi:hypothetical protein
MRPHLARALVAVVLAGMGLPGCQDGAGHTLPPDPLFAGKRPIEAKAKNSPPAAVACPDPAMPPVPAIILAASRPEAAPSVDPSFPTTGASWKRSQPKPILPVAHVVALPPSPAPAGTP